MPRKRKNTRGNLKRAGKKDNIVLYFFIAFALFGVVWWLSSDRSLSPSNKLTSISDKNKVGKNKKGNDASSDQTKSPEVKEIEAETAVEKGILLAISKLQIRDKDVKKKRKENLVAFSVPIEPAYIDLTFANMIIKGEVENQNGLFDSGIEQGRSQILSFTDKPSGKKYRVELYYKRGDRVLTGQSKVLAIIVDDFGNTGGELLAGFAKTNPAVCFAILPNTPYALEAMKMANQYGRESIIHVPMEPLNFPKENPGEHAIFVQHSPGEITRRLERFIDQLPDCIGVNNHMGSFATSDETTMQVVMQVLKKHNLLFIDSRTTSSSVAYQIAQKNLVTAFKRDVFLDEPDLSESNLNRKIAECLALSQTKPYIVTIMHCHTLYHLKYLNTFIAEAEQAGFELVPISQLSTYRLPEIP